MFDTQHMAYHAAASGLAAVDVGLEFSEVRLKENVDTVQFQMLGRKLAEKSGQIQAISVAGTLLPAMADAASPYPVPGPAVAQHCFEMLLAKKYDNAHKAEWDASPELREFTAARAYLQALDLVDTPAKVAHLWRIARRLAAGVAVTREQFANQLAFSEPVPPEFLRRDWARRADRERAVATINELGPKFCRT
jgi:hypothetical protein